MELAELTSHITMDHDLPAFPEEADTSIVNESHDPIIEGMAKAMVGIVVRVGA